VNRRIRRVNAVVSNLLGVNLRAELSKLPGLARFLRNLTQYQAMRSAGPFPVSFANLQPMLQDFGTDAGGARGHYFFQDLWAARKIFARRPEHHVDVGSRIDGFVAHLLTFMPVTVLDVRPLHSAVPGLEFVCADATTMSEYPDGSIGSLSSLHAIEHFGLGRYGDAVDPDGWRKVMDSLQRVLRPGGRLYLSVPVGRERLCFNAHRIFSPARVLDTLAGLRLVSFAAVDDAGQYHDDMMPDQLAKQEYACGLFEFTKLGAL
jgi:SAM-dependent methyltransferase